MTYPPLEDILPHAAPMILLDCVEEDAEAGITCMVKLKDRSPFAMNGTVPAIIATEYMAQSIAAYVGLKAHGQGTPIRVGYVIGAQIIRFSVDEFHVGDELHVKVQRVWGDDTLGKFECNVRSGGQVVASAALTVFQGDINAEGHGKGATP